MQDGEAAEEGEEEIDGIAYDLADWDDDQRAGLERDLDALGIEWEWDGDELVIDLADEERVDPLIEAVDFPEALPVDEEEDADEADPELLSRLFVAADRLGGNPEHAGAVDEVLEAHRGEPGGPPYGVEPGTWTAVLGALAALGEALEVRAEAGVVQGAAVALRDRLRPLV